jgi:CHAD domain-containing protein
MSPSEAATHSDPVRPATRPGEAFPLGAAATEEGLAPELARLATEIDRRSRHALAGPTGLSPQAVHAGRIGTKRVRAYWQLHKATGNAVTARQAIPRLGGAARSLAPLRDGHVLGELLAELGAQAPATQASAFERARDGLTASVGRRPVPRSARDEFLAALDADAADWLALPRVDDAEILESGLRRSFVKARELGRSALRHRQADHLHRWRRWVKYLRYQLEPFVAPRRPAVSAYHAELKELSGLLGRRNDLHNLETALEASASAPVLAAIRERERRLAATLPELDGTLFRLPADRFLASVVAELAV